MICQSVSKWAKWNLRIYLYILSAHRDYASVENMSHFFGGANAPSMDRGWRGSALLSFRYRSAIGPILQKRKKGSLSATFLKQ
jgi:hypothetical protein